MAVVSREMSVPPESVFAVLSDGWLYGLWVVGASHIRNVDLTWPDKGSHIHHAFGAWPALVRDQTVVLECTPPQRMVLQARAWPAGEARIELDIQPSTQGCLVSMNEYPVSGLGKTLDNPLAERLLFHRNVESINRLAALAENRPKYKELTGTP